MDLRLKGVQSCLLHADFDVSSAFSNQEVIYMQLIYTYLCTIYISLKLHIYAYKSYIIDANTYLDIYLLNFIYFLVF